MFIQPILTTVILGSYKASVAYLRYRGAILFNNTDSILYL